MTGDNDNAVASFGIAERSEDQPAIIQPPAWAGVFVETMNSCLDQLDVKLDSLATPFADIGDQLDQTILRMKKNAAELERLDAMLNLLLDKTTSRVPGREN